MAGQTSARSELLLGYWALYGTDAIETPQWTSLGECSVERSSQTASFFARDVSRHRLEARKGV